MAYMAYIYCAMHSGLASCFCNKVGSILDFSFDIDTGQKTSDSISIFSISVESVKFQWLSEKKHWPTFGIIPGFNADTDVFNLVKLPTKI